jgi:hypothetical protein
MLQIFNFLPCALFQPDDEARNAVLMFHTSDPTPGNTYEFLQNFYLATVLGACNGNSAVVEARYPPSLHSSCDPVFTLLTPLTLCTLTLLTPSIVHAQASSDESTRQWPSQEV